MVGDGVAILGVGEREGLVPGVGEGDLFCLGMGEGDFAADVAIECGVGEGVLGLGLEPRVWTSEFEEARRIL